jgi:hypothetical protein
MWYQRISVREIDPYIGISTNYTFCLTREIIPSYSLRLNRAFSDTIPYTIYKVKYSCIIKNLYKSTNQIVLYLIRREMIKNYTLPSALYGAR